MTTSVVFVHGGVAGRQKEAVDLSAAVGAGSGAAGGVDAIERAVMVLEDHPELNAGIGSVVTRAGNIELDAGIADGARRSVGGVAGVTVRHPIFLARRVMEQTPHVLITGAGAMALANDLERLDGPTEKQRVRWEKALGRGELDPDRFGAPEHVDTVGAVALGSSGDLAAGSSTGGVFGKLPGRVGDAPIFGTGVFANEQVAVIGTGVGEVFLEALASVRVALMVEQGDDPQRACERVIEFLGTRSEAAAGLLALDRDGRIGAAYRGGSWSVEGPAGPVKATKLG